MTAAMGGQFQELDTTDAVMSRWLQSAGLQHLASPTAAPPPPPPPPPDPRFLLPQDYARHGIHSVEDKQKLFKLIRAISSGVEPSMEPWTPSGHNVVKNMDGFSSPERRGELGAGILDLHSMDDMELLSEDAMPEPFESSPFVTVTERGYDADALWSTNKPQNSRQRLHENSPIRAAFIEKEQSARESNLARIKVVVRKRPLNKKEITRKEEDIVTIDAQGSSVTVHEPKLKVDLTAYVEKHDFVFDAVLDEHVTNDEVYKVTVEPIIPMIFQRTKATCFAYGQTGSGKTYTMQPLPLRACHDILNMMEQPSFRNQGLQLWFSFFEIYGGKLYDLLNDRRKLCMREDGRQQVCIVGLKEFPVSEVQIVGEYIERGNSARSTGSTGANEESSRSHAILQLVIKKHSQGKDAKGGKMVGKFSFIDLAGSERGADTTDNDRQTRIEGAEINKSLLALKECIRALDHEQGHIPFRGSKLTEVLRDSFVGDSRTVMISCISPNTGSCEHTLNTLRYADRVKGLSKNSNSKRDPSPNTTATVSLQRESASSPPPMSSHESYGTSLEYKALEGGKWCIEQTRRVQCIDSDGQLTSFSNESVLTKEESKTNSFSNLPNVNPSLSNQRDVSPVPYLIDKNEAEKVSPPRRKTNRDERHDKHVNVGTSEEVKPDLDQRRQAYRDDRVANVGHSRFRDPTEFSAPHNGYNGHISAILEEEEDLIAAHRLEVEDSMELVREEMKLLTEVDQPGSHIDHYVSQLSYILSRKAAGIVNLQARLARFQRHLKEQDILSNNASFR